MPGVKNLDNRRVKAKHASCKQGGSFSETLFILVFLNVIYACMSKYLCSYAPLLLSL